MPFSRAKERFSAARGDDAPAELFAIQAMSDKPGYDGYLIPFYALSDRGTFFVPQSANKATLSKLQAAPNLWQHDTWTPIGKHAAAIADDRGVRISVELNVGKQAGADAYSDLRFGIAYGLSIGFDPVADRSGTADDDAKLDRKSAPAYLKNVPINELRAVTAFDPWESSLVTFAAIGTARPDVVHAAGDVDDLAALLEALRGGTATAEQLAAAQAIVTAFDTRGTNRAAGSDRLSRIRVATAAAAEYRARSIAQGVSG